MLSPSPYVPLTWPDILVRIGLALVAGAVVGYERERHGRAAGLRTTILAGVAAAVAMILSEHLFAESINGTGAWRPDPARLAAAVLTGMGFLGGGAIIHEGNIVRGVTTAAVLWFVTVLGLAFGSGHFGLGLAGLGVAMLTLFVLPRVEGWVKNDWYGTVSLTVDETGPDDAAIKATIERQNVIVKHVQIDYDVPRRRRTLRCALKFKNAEMFNLSQRVVKSLLECPGMIWVHWD